MMCVPEMTTLANVVQLVGTGAAGFFVIDSLRMLVQGRVTQRRYKTWDEQPLDPACMRAGERMERHMEYVRRVEKQG